MYFYYNLQQFYYNSTIYFFAAYTVTLGYNSFKPLCVPEMKLYIILALLCIF